MQYKKELLKELKVQRKRDGYKHIDIGLEKKGSHDRNESSCMGDQVGE